MKWQEYALCVGMAQKRKPNGDAEDYFFDTYEKSASTREQVRELCSACPVRVACSYEGKSKKLSGVWGGEYLENGESAEGKFE